MIHRIVDAGGDKYIPFAEANLKKRLRAFGGKDFSWTVEDGGYYISARRIGGQDYIEVRGQPQVFEFYTSGWPVFTNTITQGSYEFTAYDVGIVTAGVRRAKFDAEFVANKRLSTAAGRDDAQTYGRQNWQVQLGQIPHIDVQDVGTNRDKRRFKFTISHVNLPTTGHTFAHVLTPFWSGYEGHAMAWMSDYTPTPKPWCFSLRDVGYDVINSRLPGNSPTGEQRALAPDSDWPRFWGIQDATTADGTVYQYGIYVDASGSFYAFPLSAMGDITLSGASVPLPNLDASNSRKVTPTYPSWVWRGDSATTKLKDQVGDVPTLGSRNPEWRWEFNPQGTRAAAIAYARANFGAFETAWYTEMEPEGTPLTLGEYETYCLYNNPWPVPSGMSPFSGALPNGYESWSGLPRNFAGAGVLEATITVTKANNTDPNDFTLAVTVASVLNPMTDSQHAPLAVGYLWHAPEGGQAVDPGDLLVLENAWFADPIVEGTEYTHYEALRLRNVTKSALVFSNIRGWVRGLDLRTLSFFVQTMITGQSGDVTVPRGEYFSDQPLPPYYTETYTDKLVIARPAHYVIIRGKAVRVFVPDDVPASMATTVETLQARTVDDWMNAASTIPAGVLPIYQNTVWTPAELRASSTLRSRLTLWFGEGVYFALVWAAAPAGLTGYPVGWLAGAKGAHTYLHMPMVDSTFYVHANGSWAVFDSTTFYNTLGIPSSNSSMARVGQTGQLLSASHFKWHVVDAVEIRRHGSSKTMKTTFVELYNKAQAKHAAAAAAGGVAVEFSPLVLQDTLPTFSLHTQYVQNYSTPSPLGTTEYTLGISFSDGSVVYRRLPVYHSGGMLFPDPEILNDHQAWPAWCLVGDSNDMMFYDAACTQIAPADGMHSRYTFRISSPRLLTAPLRN